MQTVTALEPNVSPIAACDISDGTEVKTPEKISEMTEGRSGVEFEGQRKRGKKSECIISTCEALV